MPKGTLPLSSQVEDIPSGWSGNAFPDTVQTSVPELFAYRWSRAENGKNRLRPVRLHAYDRFLMRAGLARTKGMSA